MQYRLKKDSYLLTEKDRTVIYNTSTNLEKSFYDSGKFFTLALSHKCKSLEELAQEILSYFVNVDINVITEDAKQFFDILVSEGYLVSGESLTECNAKEYGWGYDTKASVEAESQHCENKAYFHLPGLFSHYNLYKKFLPIFYNYREFFYPWADIGSIYGSPSFAIWNSGRARSRSTKISADLDDVISLLKEYNISGRFTFSNSLLKESHLTDTYCNFLCEKFNLKNNGVIIGSDLLKEYISKKYHNFYFVSSTTKSLNTKELFFNELNDDSYSYVVPDYNFNNNFEVLSEIPEDKKGKVEFLCDESCMSNCPVRKESYERISRSSLFLEEPENDSFECPDKRPYNKYFSRIKKNKTFISNKAIEEKYLPMGFSNFKLEGREYGESRLLEEILYYMVKPDYHLDVREMLYLNPYVDFPVGRRP